MKCVRTVCIAAVFFASMISGLLAADRFEGRFYRGEGDVEYLQLLDISRRMFSPDPEFQNMSMLYAAGWNGLVEGPTWSAWWIQNSYGTTYCALPFLEEPFITFLQNSQDLWFNQMGDGQRKGYQGMVAPDGCLCDCASPAGIAYKQGDGNTRVHDWALEFTAAGVVLQAELLLISRDDAAIKHYLPMLERSANFLETRRNPKNNLFLAGPAGNLLAPNYAGWTKPDGTYGKAYLAGLSISYIAAMDRLIEVEKLAGNAEKARLYANRRALARKGLPLLTTREGYFVKSMDPDGTQHGVYGAAKHGYFDAVCNHDAICFRVADDAQAKKIYRKIASIPGLRLHDLIITNYPSLDDMYSNPEGMYKFGYWVNGGHWSTCEARMMMGYYRLGKYDDARRSMTKMLDYARRFRMDNPLTDFGSGLNQPNQPINCCYDNWGVPAAMIRGQFEYLYRADELTILPHIPSGITRLEQNFPIRFGKKQIFLATTGQGSVTGVTMNGQAWKKHDAKSVSLPFDQIPNKAVIQISLGGAITEPFVPHKPDEDLSLPSIAELKLLAEPSSVATANSQTLRIGADGAGGNHFVGAIAVARVFGRSLTPAEITKLARGESATDIANDSLIGEWKMSQREGRIVPNTRRENLPAKIVGEVGQCDGPLGKAALLTGQGYLEVAADPCLELRHELTLDAWIRPGKLPPSGARIIDKGTVGGSDGFVLDTFPGNSLRMILDVGPIADNAQLAADKWVHVAATADRKATIALYIDGKQVAVQKGGSQGIDWPALLGRMAAVRNFHSRMVQAGLENTYEAAHARLIIECLNTTAARLKMVAVGKLPHLPDASQAAADRSYIHTFVQLCDGLERVVRSYEKSEEPNKREIYRLWAN